VTIIEGLYPQDRSLAELPPINRARFHYLYDKKGRRYLDLEQGRGTWAGGYRLQNQTNPLKNLLSRGVSGFQPHRKHGELPKVLRQDGIEGEISRFLTAEALEEALIRLKVNLRTVWEGEINLHLPWLRRDLGHPWTLILMPCGGRPGAVLAGPERLAEESWTVMETAWFVADYLALRKVQRQTGFFEGLEETLFPRGGAFYFSRPIADPYKWSRRALERGFYVPSAGPLFPPGWFSPGEKAAFRKLIQETLWSS
jgi:hypothetical protein